LGADVTQLTLTLRHEPGQSLDKHVDSHGKSTLSSEDSTTLWKQISGALAHLHASSITHDDVKPDNIMWDPPTHHSVLIDFGAALNHKVLPPGWFSPSGTPSYAPPEFLQRRKGNAGDVWALGVTMLFAFGYIKLPDGEWILPHVFEQELVLEEMKSWLGEVEDWRRKVLAGKNASDGLLAGMLEQDPDKRIVAVELELRLKALES
jgi:serine/threonine protein kinase